MRCAGIILCGGKSTRMGRPKAMLPFGPEWMLARVARRLGEAVGPIVAVAAVDQPLPDLPDGVLIARDRRSGRGPLEGLAAGLAALIRHDDGGPPVEAAYATSCDVPLLSPRFVRRMVDLLGGHEIAVPVDDRFHHPLAAVYRLSVSPKIERLLAADRLRPTLLFDEADTRLIAVDELRQADPALDTLTNCNHPEDYAAAWAKWDRDWDCK